MHREERKVNGLSVGDGFKFGCGFFLAMLVAWVAVVIIGAILSLILTAVFGLTLGSIFSDLSTSFLPQLVGLI
jgi:hypothetical protein